MSWGELDELSELGRLSELSALGEFKYNTN